MLAYYLDEDSMNRNLVRAMRLRGLDVVSPSEVGMTQHRDEEHLAYATQQGRILYSFNVCDFCRLHDEWLRLNKPHAGILLAHQWQRDSIGAQLRGLLWLSSKRSAADMQGCLEYLRNWI